jgi:hypothetical protein
LQQKKQELDVEQQRKLNEFEQMKQFLETNNHPPQQPPQHQPPQHQHQPQHQHPQHQHQPSIFNHHNMLNTPQINNADEIRRININSQLNLIRDRVEKIDTDNLLHKDKNNTSTSSSSSVDTSVEQKVSSSRKNSKEGNSTYARRKNTKKTISFDT